MIKDRYQKQKLLFYFLSRFWYPQLEVQLFYRGTMNSKPRIITDLDTVALSPSEYGLLRPVIGDCKTLKSQSPVNRAFWLKGIMDWFGSDSGIVLLTKDIEREHKLLANDLNIVLLSENDFKSYSLATAQEYPEVGHSFLGSLETWETYFNIGNKFSKLAELINYSRIGFWNEENYGVKLRRSLSKLRSVCKSIDPGNKLELGIFLELASLFAVALNELVVKIFGKLIWTDDKENFDKELKVLLWGGHDSYQYYNEIRNKLLQTTNTPSEGLSLPEWPLFLQLVRECLEKPISTAISPLIIKEYAFSFFSKQNSLIDAKEYLKILASQDRYAIKQAMLVINYFSKCAAFPRETNDFFMGDLMKLSRN